MTENEKPDGQAPEQLLKRAYGLKDSDEARALYRDWAESYDATMLDGLAYLTPSRTAAMLARHLADKGAKILDVGCGTGLAGAELSRLGYTNIDALDYSPEMLAVAGKRGVYGALIEADLTDPLAIETASYDALICTGTFTHAHVDAACLDELLRILAPGGYFACTIHNDVWQPMGFAKKVGALMADGVLKVCEENQGVYFETDEVPQGRYVTWVRGN